MAPPVPSPLPPVIWWGCTQNSYLYQIDTTDSWKVEYTRQYLWKTIPEGHIIDTVEYFDDTIKKPKIHFTLNQDLPINQPSPIVTTSQQPPPPSIIFTAPLPPTSTPIFPSTILSHQDRIKVNKPEPFDGDQSKYHSFMISTSLYLATLPNLQDGKRITFFLSCMTAGSALMWRDHFVKINMNKIVKFDTFTTLLVLTFKDTNAEAKS